MNLEVTEALIVQDGYGPDLLLLYLNLPNPQFPYNGQAGVKMHVAAGNGWNYFTTHFPRTKYTRMLKGTDGKYRKTEGVTDEN